MQDYEYKDISGRYLCKLHDRLRCDECHYVSELKEQNKRYREALKFYADEENYKPFDGIFLSSYQNKVDEDGGEVAQKSTGGIGMSKERLEEYTHIAVRKDEYKKLKEQAELYREALSRTRYAIHTQISTMNNQENTNLERSYMKGILFASKMINRYFNKVVERLEESK